MQFFTVLFADVSSAWFFYWEIRDLPLHQMWRAAVSRAKRYAHKLSQATIRNRKMNQNRKSIFVALTSKDRLQKVTRVLITVLRLRIVIYACSHGLLSWLCIVALKARNLNDWNFSPAIRCMLRRFVKRHQSEQNARYVKDKFNFSEILKLILKILELKKNIVSSVVTCLILPDCVELFVLS